MNSYMTSSGEYVLKSVIDRRIRAAKEKKIAQMIEKYGYLFCEECHRNEAAGIPLDCSHDIPVSECQKRGQSELAWDVNNITIRCWECHHKHDHQSQFSNL